MPRPLTPDHWNTRLGAVLAVAGSAVGLGNFLRFPGQVALYGGGAFMVAYAISFILIGIPLCLAEWTMGRYAGQRGFHSSAGILACTLRHPAGKYLGAFNIVVPICLFMYYACIEAWTLGYAVNAATGALDFRSIDEAKSFFAAFAGTAEDGGGLSFSLKTSGIFLVAVLLVNLVILWNGVSRGIERFCKIAMPALILIGVVILARVLTLGTPNPEFPERNIDNGLGFMWNPSKVVLETRDTPSGEWRRVPTLDGGDLVGETAISRARAEAALNPQTVRVVEITMWRQLAAPQLWLAAAGQVFFTLSVGMGVLSTYASYLRRKDDVIVGALSSASINEVCEVGLGGLITLPAGVAFLGVASLAGMCSTFDLGFNVLPLVFAQLPLGELFAFLFFFLLFLASATSSISMLQPGIAFLEEALGTNRKQSISVLSMLMVFGAAYCFYFSKDLHAIDTLDFWGGNFLVFVCGTLNIIAFSWFFPLERGWRQMHRGAAVRLPNSFKLVFKWLAPCFLVAIFAYWTLVNVFSLDVSNGDAALRASAYVSDLFVNPSGVAWLGLAIMAFFLLFGALIVRASPRLPLAHRARARLAARAKKL